MPNEEEDKYDDYDEIIQYGGNFEWWHGVLYAFGGVLMLDILARLYYCSQKNDSGLKVLGTNAWVPWPFGMMKFATCTSLIEEFIEQFLQELSKELKIIARKKSYITYKMTDFLNRKDAKNNKVDNLNVDNLNIGDLNDDMKFLVNACEKIITQKTLFIESENFSFFELMSTEWNNKSINKIFNKMGKETVSRIFNGKDEEENKIRLTEYISFDIFFCTINDVIIDKMIETLKYDLCAVIKGKKPSSFSKFKDTTEKA